MRRTTTPDERKLFEASLAAPRPKTAKPVLPKKKSKKAKAGIDGHTARKLREGELPPDIKIDLHGLTQERAYRTLLESLRPGPRLVLVVTGRSGILKNIVPRWLAEPAFSARIAGTATAHRRHGGEGALYVYLRK